MKQIAIIAFVVFILVLIYLSDLKKRKADPKKQDGGQDVLRCSEFPSIHELMRYQLANAEAQYPSLSRPDAYKKAKEVVIKEQSCVFDPDYPLYCSLTGGAQGFQYHVRMRYQDLNQRSQLGIAPYSGMTVPQLWQESINQVSSEWSCTPIDDPEGGNYNLDYLNSIMN